MALLVEGESIATVVSGTAAQAGRRAPHFNINQKTAVVGSFLIIKNYAYSALEKMVKLW
ncbi:MAG: hypothetical protein HYT15_00560 [Candidatus Magasanikbacteria bacterium]|nr:hypothetical protein [Candidatus Magasanikbacteria bacterium]